MIPGVLCKTSKNLRPAESAEAYVAPPKAVLCAIRAIALVF